MKHWFYVNLTGIIWLIGGSKLILKGIKLLEISHLNMSSLVLVFLAAVVGTLKNIFVLKKTIKRVIARITSLTIPIAAYKVYDKRFYILVGLMIMISFFMDILRVPCTVRGFVDFAIGFALLQGSLRYFKFSLALKKASYF